MNNWRKYRNFLKYENPDGTFTYIIIVDGEKVAVNGEIYAAYAQGGYKMENMEYGLKSDRVLKDANGRAVRDENGYPVVLPEREVSLDKLIEENREFASLELLPEDILVEHFEIHALNHCLTLLDNNEFALINALYFKKMTERELAVLSGVPQKTINDRKRKILSKLKNLLET